MNKINRIILKLSGEVMSGPTTGPENACKILFDKKAIQFIVDEIYTTIKTTKCQIAIMIGGGNIIRGSQIIKSIDSSFVVADQAGMIITVANGIILQDCLERTRKIQTRVMSALTMQSIAEPYIRRRAMRHLEKGYVVILTGGTGLPRFTTDTAAILRAIEIDADLIIKGTKVDGIYDKDPKLNSDSKFIEKISSSDFIKQKLQIMDNTAIVLANENQLPIRVINIFKKGNLAKAIKGENIGSLIIPD